MRINKSFVWPSYDLTTLQHSQLTMALTNTSLAIHYSDRSFKVRLHELLKLIAELKVPADPCNSYSFAYSSYSLAINSSRTYITHEVAAT